MYGKEKTKSPRNAALVLDMLHIAIGIVIVVLAVFAFINPEGNQFLFPFIFLLAGILNGINGLYKVRESGRDKKKRMGGIAVLILAGFLLGICVLSALSIWR